MESFNLEDHPHRCKNVLIDDWVLVSLSWIKRPWQGRVESIPTKKRPQYESSCYLCQGDERAGEKQNPEYKNQS